MQLSSYLRQYVRDIWTDWVGRMSGIAGIVFLVVALVFRLTEIGQARYWIAAAALSYVVASFVVWRKERLAIVELQQTIETLNRNIESLNQAGGGTAITPQELMDVYNNRTTMQGEKLVRAHVGKEMTVSARFTMSDRSAWTLHIFK